MAVALSCTCVPAYAGFTSNGSNMYNDCKGRCWPYAAAAISISRAIACMVYIFLTSLCVMVYVCCSLQLPITDYRSPITLRIGSVHKEKPTLPIRHSSFVLRHFPSGSTPNRVPFSSYFVPRTSYFNCPITVPSSVSSSTCSSPSLTLCDRSRMCRQR